MLCDFILRTKILLLYSSLVICDKIWDDLSNGTPLKKNLIQHEGSQGDVVQSLNHLGAKSLSATQLRTYNI